MLGLKIGIIKRPRSAPKPVRAGEGRSVIHPARCPLPAGKGSPWQAINPYYYSLLETWKGDEKGNRDENGSKKRRKNPRTKTLHGNKTLKAPGGAALKHIPSVPFSSGHHQTLLAAKGEADFRSRGGHSPGKRLGSRGLASCSPRASQADKQKKAGEGGRERGRSAEESSDTSNFLSLLSAGDRLL